jgi:dihydrodipicolinate synthase/N-acetylneuraminate lyase
MTALTQLVVDLSKLEAELSRFETRFGVKSQEFYEAMMRGDLEEFDALDDYRMEFIEWLALYKTWLSLDGKYHQLIARQPVVLQIKANLEPVSREPQEEADREARWDAQARRVSQAWQSEKSAVEILTEMRR